MGAVAYIYFGIDLPRPDREAERALRKIGLLDRGETLLRSDMEIAARLPEGLNLGNYSSRSPSWFIGAVLSPEENAKPRWRQRSSFDATDSKSAVLPNLPPIPREVDQQLRAYSERLGVSSPCWRFAAAI